MPSSNQRHRLMLLKKIKLDHQFLTMGKMASKSPNIKIVGKKVNTFLDLAMIAKKTLILCKNLVRSKIQ